MIDDPTPDLDRAARIERALAEYLLASDAGAAADPAAWLAQYPELQPELGELLAAEAGLRRLADPLRHAPGQVISPEASTSGPGGHHADLAETIAGHSESATSASRPAPDPRAATDRVDGDAVTTDGDPEADSAPLLAGARVRYFGDYEIRHELGRGGMGVVYEARQLSLNRPVALKMIKAGVLADDAELRRFQNEAEAVAILDHPGIVPVHEVGEHDGQRYFSMKLIPGASLAAQLDRYGDDPRAATRLVAEAADAVHHAHMRGILHRDLKPANILIDEQGHPHVTDFGLAKRVEGDSNLTQSGAILGTPAYMAPEQTTGHRGAVTTATDVYGLGAVLYALLAGKAPFGGDSVIETLDAVRSRAPEPPTRLNPRLSRDLELICLKCLEKEPARRYRSAEALAEDLRRWLDGRPITARPVSPATRAWMWCRRHPVPAGLAAALVLAVLAGSIASTALWLRAERNYRNEQAARAEAQARLDLALAAIRTYYTGVSEDVLLKEPQMKALREKLLKTALDFYRRLQESLKGDPGPKAQADLAEAYSGVGAITLAVGSMRDAEQAFEQALAIRERLAAADPANDDYQRALAGSLSWHGEDGRNMARALAIRERLAKAHPDVVRDQINLAWSLVNPGTPEGSRTDDKPTVHQLRRNGERLKAMISVYPDVPEIRRYLADLHRWLGVRLYIQGDIEGMLRAYKDCQQVLEGMPTPLTTFDRWLLALAHDGVGSALRSLGRPAEALPALRKAVELRERNFADYPVHHIARLDLGSSLSELGDLQRELGLIAQAGETLRRSRAIHEDLARDDPSYKHLLIGVDISLGRLEGALGRTAEAIQVLRRAVALWEELVAGLNHSNKDDRLNINIMRGIIGVFDALIEVRGPIEPMLAARALIDRLDREGRLGSVAQREALVWLDIRIAKAQQQAGQSAEARETIRRVESELEILRDAVRPSDYGYNLACALALLSTLVGRPEVAPSPIEQAEIRGYQDRAMDALRRAIAVAGHPRWKIRTDHDLDPLRPRPDFQALMLDLAFPADPFAR
jgi:tetratricopeptide (TPR) repeat protein/predicted Ser/Thr protein kinase